MLKHTSSIWPLKIASETSAIGENSTGSLVISRENSSETDLNAADKLFLVTWGRNETFQMVRNSN